MAAHPTVADMIEHPYGVLSNYTDPDGETYPGVYANAVTSAIPTFQGHFDLLIDKVLLQAAANEREKEWAYINTFLDSIKGLEEYDLYRDLINLCTELKTPLSSKNQAITSISKIVDTIQKVKTGLYDIDKSLKQNEAIFKEFNKLASTNSMSTALRKVLNASGPLNGLTFGAIDINKTGEQIIDEAIEKYQIEIDEASKKNNFNDKQTQILLQLIEVYKNKLREFYINKLSAVSNDPLHISLLQLEQAIKNYDSKTIDNKKKLGVSKKGIPKTISQVIWDTINGVLGGKGVEYTIDLSGGGKNTGTILGSGGKSIDADNIQLASADLKYYYDERNTDLLSQNTKNIDFNIFKKDIEKINELERRFMIMTSAKDQSTNAKFTDFYAGSETVKIKGTGSLASRKPEIEEMYNTIDNVGHKPSDLIFSIANLAADFVCSGQTEQAKRTLGAVCIAWMFDDAKEIVTGVQFIQGSNDLHFYNLNGKYYTLSDVLELTAQDLSRKSLAEYTSASSDGMKYVKVNITVPRNNPYEEMLKRKKQPPEGMEQWNEVADVLMNKTQVGITMSPKNLFQDLFGV